MVSVLLSETDFLQSLLHFISRNLDSLGEGFFFICSFYIISKQNKKFKKGREKLQESIKKNIQEPNTLHPEIDESKCLGCGTCTKACPEGSVLQLINHKAVLVSPTKCIGHGVCETVCPMGAISLVFGTKTRGMEIPRISPHFETNVTGLYIAGELGGMGRIRNAIFQGSQASNHAISTLRPENSSHFDYDLLIVGAGPAGLASSLAATKAKKKYLCIDQNSFGGTINNFPRQKLVMVQPIELPMVGFVKFKKNIVSKEELLESWTEIRKKYEIQIAEKTQFVSFEKLPNGFSVKLNTKTVTTQKIILSMGVNGSPRKLGLANEDLAKVSYRLVDPKQYVGQQIAVVGGGNSAVEAAQYLSSPELNNKVILIVRGNEDTGLSTCAEDNKKILFDKINKGEIKAIFNSAVTAISENALTIQVEGQSQEVENNFLFIFAGFERPYKFLNSIGVIIDTKFGEGLKAA